MVRNGFVAAERLMLLRAVHQHHCVFVRLMAEVVVNSFQLHQAADEVKAAFLILHAVFPHPVIAGELVFYRHVVFGKQRFDDLRYRLALEDAQVSVALQGPQVRLHHQAVNRIARAAQLGAADRHFGDFPVQVTGCHQVLGGDGHGHGLPQQGLTLNAGIGAQELDGDFKRAGKRLRAVQFPEQQAVHRQLNCNAIKHDDFPERLRPAGDGPG